MTRLFSATALALCLPVQALADDILLRADIAEALVFAQGAEVVRRVEADLTAGRHTLLIPLRGVRDPTAIEITGPEGVVLGVPQAVDRIAIPEGALDTGIEAEARIAADTAEDALEAARDALARRDAELEALEIQLSYLEALAGGGPEGARMPASPDELAEVLGLLGAQTARVGAELQAARAARREDAETVADRERDLANARRALEDLGAFGRDAPGIRVEVEAARPVSGEIAIAYLAPQARWFPTYDLRLDTGASRLEVERSIRFEWGGDATFRDVETRFSTALPNRRRLPSTVRPDPVRIAEPVPEASLAGAATPRTEARVADAPLALADTSEMIVSGVSVVYDYAAPVTVGPAGRVALPFDDIGLDVTLENRAVPRRDATAFLLALGENDSGEPVLPGPARFFRDGDLVGEAPLPMIPAGGEVELGFGPLDHLVLDWRDLSRDEGRQGVFISENAQSRLIAFGVRNTSAGAEGVRLLYPVPFSEQEALDLVVGFSRAPDARDVDGMRGVAAWDLDLAPGEEVQIEMRVDLAWPEDMVLDWQP
jgi:uncharacterized protein (TIGR02231 family)